MAAKCVCINLRRAASSVTRLYDEMLAPSGLLVTQFSLLLAIERAGEPRLGELAEAMELDRTTLTRNLKPLERQGLIEISAGDDPRTRRVVVTEVGSAAIARARPLWAQAQQAVRSAVGDEALDDMLRRLAALRRDVRSVPATPAKPATRAVQRDRSR
ncbi:MAG TPA: MarR family winged helix-turn-helix transcriptional regulator [Burkholderiales bacterium]|nr:MarR family winged helix-turn-helix transcriptional regulator [Burkholderiales bacterium]